MLNLSARLSVRCAIAAVRILLPVCGVVTPAVSGPAMESIDGPLERIAFGSCASEQRAQPIWTVIEEQDPQVFIFAGDNIYGDSDDPAVLRQRYHQLNAIPEFAAFRKKVPLLATWDDHDYGRNDAGVEYPIKRESQQAFLDFFGVSTDSPRREREGIYHSEVIGPVGKRTQIILLDTRYHRSRLERAPAPEGRRRGPYKPAAYRDQDMLGETQWAWLEEQLRVPAEIRLIVSSIQVVAEDHIYEKWINLPREHRRLMSLIEDTGANGIVFLSGDRHHAELSHRLAGRVPYPLYDLTSSGLNQSRARSGEFRVPENNRFRVQGPYRGHHFGMVTIDWDAPQPRLDLEIIDSQGDAVIAEAIHLDEITRDGRQADVTSASTLVSADELAIDGSIDDWDTPGHVAASGSHLAMRFRTPDLRTLRRHAEEITIGLDLDDDTSTGNTAGPIVGIDLAIHIGQRREGRDAEGRRWRGPFVTKYDASGQSTDIYRDAASMELFAQVAPTHASHWHEVRLDRDAADALELPALAAAGPGRAYVLATHRENQTSTVLVDEAYEQPAFAAVDTGDAVIPDKVDGAVRVMAINVLWGQPRENPEPFARVFDAIDADIYLIQEWERSPYTETELLAWFKKHINPDAAWSAMVTGVSGRGSGTAVVTAHPIVAKLPAYSPVETERWDFPARIAGATIDTPSGRFVVGNVHFKAGGALDSLEDVRRRAEAMAVNRLLTGLSAATQPDVVVFGGDYNLNGSTEIVELAVRHLDRDMSSLTVASPHVLGRPGLLYTHGRSSSKNRLDFISWSDSTAAVTDAFVLDTQVLSAKALDAMGLQRDDTEATDHLPVVVDLLPYAHPTSSWEGEQH